MINIHFTTFDVVVFFILMEKSKFTLKSRKMYKQNEREGNFYMN